MILGENDMRKRAGLFRAAVILSLVASVFVFGSTRAWAQGATAAPFNKVTVSDDVAKRTLMKAVINADTARAFLNITPQVEECLRESGVREGLVLVNAMHITASVFINDNESGLHHDYDVWLERLAARVANENEWS